MHGTFNRTGWHFHIKRIFQSINLYNVLDDIQRHILPKLIAPWTCLKKNKELGCRPLSLGYTVNSPSQLLSASLVKH